MKLKFLKKVSINSYEFKMVWDKNTSGGSISFEKMEIMVGIKLYPHSPTQTFAVLMHELSEAIHIINCTRYDDGSVQGNYKFFQDHKEFEVHTETLAETLNKFIEWK